MDVFATILITITILTICGICLFIFICALQTKILHCLHKRRERIYYITALKRINEAEADLNITQLDLENRFSSNELDRRNYLKALERSVRTGRRIQEEKYERNSHIHNNSQSTSFFFLRRFIDQYLSPTNTITTANTQGSTDI